MRESQPTAESGAEKSLIERLLSFFLPRKEVHVVGQCFRFDGGTVCKVINTSGTQIRVPPKAPKVRRPQSLAKAFQEYRRVGCWFRKPKPASFL